MIRRAKLEDATALTAMERDLFGMDAWSAASVIEELSGPSPEVWVYTSEDAPDIDAVIGTVITRWTGDTTDLLRIAVASSWQRRGIAGALLDVAVTAAREDGALWMVLEVSADNSAALEFYATHGFDAVHRRPRYYRDGSDAIVMQLEVQEQ